MACGCMKRRRGLSDLPQLHKHGRAKLVVPDLAHKVFYVWSGGNTVCAYTKQFQDPIKCWGMTEHTQEAARKFAHRKIREYMRDPEKWEER